jgi:hypothetical protein
MFGNIGVDREIQIANNLKIFRFSHAIIYQL